MSSDRVMRWGLITKEYGPNFFNIPGPNTLVTCVLSRLPKMDEVPIKYILSKDVQEKNACTKDVNDEFPLGAGVVAQAQWNELSLCT